jgi:hypothetical protein
VVGATAPGGVTVIDRYQEINPALIFIRQYERSSAASRVTADTQSRTKKKIAMNTNSAILTAARTEALFTSVLATGSDPAYDIVEQAIRTAVRTHGGVRGCAADVASEYGDYPDTAVPRMRWARHVVHTLYPPPAYARGS